MAKTQFSILILLIYSTCTWAQSTTILEEGEAKTITINYNESTPIGYNNNFVKILIKSAGGDISALKLNFDIKEHRKIVQKNGKLYLTIAIGNIVKQGEHIYMNFPVNQFLTPSQVSFTYHWVDKDGNEIESELMKNLHFKSGEDIVKLTKSDDGKSLSSKLFLSDISFSYSESDFKKFDDYITGITTYYDADAKLNMINQELDKITTDSIELLESYRDITLNNIQYFDLLKAERLNSRLDLPSYDPIRLRAHLGQTEERNRELKKQLELSLKNMHETYYKKGLDWLSWKNNDTASAYFNLSIHHKNTYAPPYYELAKLDFSKKQYKAVLDTCAMIINTKKPDTDTRYNTIKLAEKVIYIYLDSVQSFIIDKKYTEASNKLDYCTNYVKHIDGISHFDEFATLQGKIIEGYYNNMILVAKQQINDKQLVTASKSIDSLYQYRINNKTVYIKPDKENELLSELYKAWINTGNSYLEDKRTDSALYALTQANIICHKYDFITCTTELDLLLQKAYTNNYIQMLNLAQDAINEELADSAINILDLASMHQKTYNLEPIAKADTLYLKAKQLKYNGLINEGIFALNGGDGQQALAFFEEAIDISQQITIDINTQIDSLTQNAAAAYIFVLCSQCETYIEALQMDKAQAGFNKAKSLEQRYRLSLWDEVSKAINRLANLLNQGECNQAQYNFNVQYGAAKRFVNDKNFDNAQNSINKAKTIAKQTPNCEINTNELLTLEKEINGIKIYKQKLNKIEEQIVLKQYSNAINNYLLLTNFYSDSVKFNYDIKHKELFNYINTHTNNELLNQGAIYFTEQSAPDKALSLLNELYARKYIASWAENSQTKLGEYLARQDFEADNTLNPSEQINNYTNYLSWFKYLKKAYLAQWKSML